MHVIKLSGNEKIQNIKYIIINLDKMGNEDLSVSRFYQT